MIEIRKASFFCISEHFIDIIHAKLADHVGADRFSGGLQPFTIKHRMRKPLAHFYFSDHRKSRFLFTGKKSKAAAFDIRIVSFKLRSRNTVFRIAYGLYSVPAPVLTI